MISPDVPIVIAGNKADLQSRMIPEQSAIE